MEVKVTSTTLMENNKYFVSKYLTWKIVKNVLKKGNEQGSIRKDHFDFTTVTVDLHFLGGQW